MAIFNNYCDKCIHEGICKIQDKLYVFHEEAKKPLGVDVTVEVCSNFSIEESDE